MDQDTSRNDRHGEQGIGPLGHVTEWEALALDYLDGRLGVRELSLVERHLNACPQCRAALENQRWIASWSHSVKPAQTPADLSTKIFEALNLEPSLPARAVDEGSVQTEASATVTADTVPALDTPEADHRKSRRPAAPAPGWADRVRSLFQPRNLAIAAAMVAIVVVGVVTLQTQETALQRVATGPVATTTSAAATTVSVPEGPQTPQTSTTVQVGGAGATTTGSEAVSTTTTIPVVASVTVTTGESTLTSAAVSTSTTVLNAGDTTTASTPLTLKTAVPGAPEPIWLAFSREEATVDDVAAGFQQLTGLQPLPGDQWMGGPTFAVVASRADVTTVLDYLRTNGFRVEASPQPADLLGNAVNLILAGFTSYPVVSLSAGAMRTQRVQYSKLPPDDHALLVFFTAR